MSTRNKKKEESDSYSFFNFLGQTMNKVGVPGFVVLVLCYMLFFFTTSTQKEELINTWFLFKNPNVNVSVLINIILFIIILFHNFNYKKEIKLLRDQLAMTTQSSSLSK